MTARNQAPQSPADEQAALWAARLDGSTLTDRDWEKLQVWLDADSSHRTRLSAYCQLGAQLEYTLTQPAAQRLVTSEHRRSTPFRRVAWLGLAAAAALVIAAVTWQPAGRSYVSHVLTAPAERTALTLPEGSRIEVHARTELHIALGPGERRVRLVEGEAYFAVAHDLERPFYVDTSAGSIRVTGTAFAVRASPSGSLTVLVVEGHVQVKSGDVTAPPVELHIGQRLRAESGHSNVDTLSEGDIAKALAWRDGQAAFAGAPVAEALACFAEYHGRELMVSPDAAMLTLGGRYQLDDLDGFLSALELALPLHVSRGVNGSIVVSRRTSE